MNKQYEDINNMAFLYEQILKEMFTGQQNHIKAGSVYYVKSLLIDGLSSFIIVDEDKGDSVSGIIAMIEDDVNHTNLIVYPGNDTHIEKGEFFFSIEPQREHWEPQKEGYNLLAFGYAKITLNKRELTEFIGRLDQEKMNYFVNNFDNFKTPSNVPKEDRIRTSLINKLSI